jgi:hypothetical protein
VEGQARNPPVDSDYSDRDKITVRDRRAGLGCIG